MFDPEIRSEKPFCDLVFRPKTWLLSIRQKYGDEKKTTWLPHSNMFWYCLNDTGAQNIFSIFAKCMIYLKTKWNNQWILKKEKSFEKTHMHLKRHWIHIKVFALVHVNSPSSAHLWYTLSTQTLRNGMPKKYLYAVLRDINKRTEELKRSF